MATYLYQTFSRWPLLPRIFFMAVFSIILFGFVIHLVEPKTFPSTFDGIWWAIITASTVGYGDYTPHTTAGRLVGILLILVGASFLSSYFATLATTAINTQNTLKQGKSLYIGKKQTLIIGWNERSRDVINQLIQLKNEAQIVLIDDSLTENPFPGMHVHFIKGKPFYDHVLTKANAKSAELLLVTADQNTPEYQADMNTILTLIAVKGINPEVHSIVEILTAEHVLNAERAGADEIIQTNKQTSYVMMNSILAHGMASSLLIMLNQLKGSSLKFISVDRDWMDRPFNEISRILSEQRVMLLGYKRGENSIVNPPPDDKIHLNDQLLVISD
ncbi:potassium channel family protein [Falsibacillus pallidus]|uniref:potassium channel family protein n=1 Tax=Falsibacillus pallidus TaxID=493781 RepID=UPI003D97C379